MNKMLGLTVPGGNQVALSEFPVPEPGYDELLIEVRSSGLCGSDLHAYSRPRPSPGEPDALSHLIAGHEPSGVVAGVGAGVTGFKVGDRVFTYHISGCGLCHQCRLGYMVNCISSTRAAYGGHRHGADAKYMLATERTVINLPDELSFLDGAMLACTAATAYGACLRAELSAKDTVLITGLGPVGLTVALFAMAFGARVTAMDVNQERVHYAKKIGLPQVWKSTDDVIDGLATVTHGLGPSVTIDCSGNDAARLLALQTIGTWGRAIFVGFGGALSQSIPVLSYFRSNLPSAVRG